MSAVKRFPSAIIFVSLLLSATNAQSNSIEERSWIRMDSANFTIHSVLTRTDTRALLRHLEAVRSLFSVATDENSKAQIPTEIYAVRTENEFKDLGFDPDGVVGVFQPRLRQHTIIIRQTVGNNDAGSVVHEYVHFLLSSMMRFPFPRWYEEGYAEYVSSSTLGAGHFVIGQLDAGTIIGLDSGRWQPMEDVINSQTFNAIDSRVLRRKFYAQSFLLTHYLWARPDREQSVTESLTKYANALQGGSSEVEAFEIGFEIAVEDLESELKKYLKRRKFSRTRYDTKSLIPNFSPTTSKLSKAEISVELGELILGQLFDGRERDSARIARARELYERALKEKTTRARAEIGIAYILEMEGEPEAATDYLTSGASLAPDDLNVQLDAAQFWLNRIDGEQSDRDHLIAQAYPYLLNAVRINEYSPEVAYTSGLFYTKLGEAAQGAALIERAAHRAPGVKYLRWILANLLADLDRPEEALRYARDVLLFSHDSNENQAAARALIERLEGSTGTHSAESN